VLSSVYGENSLVSRSLAIAQDEVPPINKITGGKSGGRQHQYDGCAPDAQRGLRGSEAVLKGPG